MIELMLHAERTLAMGLTDQAEKLYRQALEQDSRNAIAVVGLARVALARDDDRSAYDLAVEALRIDPENAAALRLEARLSEVLAARGDPVQRERFVVEAVAAARRRGERELEEAGRNAPRAEPGRPDYAPTPGTRFAAIIEAQQHGGRAPADPDARDRNSRSSDAGPRTQTSQPADDSEHRRSDGPAHPADPPAGRAGVARRSLLGRLLGR